MAGVKLDLKVYTAVQSLVRRLIASHGDAQVFAALRRYMERTRQARRLEREIKYREEQLVALKTKAGRR